MDEAVKEASVVHGEEILHPNSVADRRRGAAGWAGRSPGEIPRRKRKVSIGTPWNIYIYICNV